MVFKNAYFVEFSKGYQPAKFQFCGLYGSSFTEGSPKFQYFVKLVISYQPAKFQIPQLFESNFAEVFIRHPKILL